MYLPSLTAAVTVGDNQLMKQTDNKINIVPMATPDEPIVTLT